MAQARRPHAEKEERQAPRLRLKRRLGQHLLRDRRIVRRIVRALRADEQDLVLEIGPGLGALTRPLLRTGARVVGVERDPALAEELARKLAGEGGLEIIRGDVLQVSLAEVCRAHGKDRLKVIGNIPYRITSPIIHWLLGQLSWVGISVLTIQREVAERLASPPGRKSYGALTLAVAQRAEVERVLDIPAEAFRPAPRVGSAVVRITPRTRPAVEVPDERFLESLIRHSFGQRRKMLRRSLLSQERWNRQQLEEAARRASISLSRRPEELSLEEFGRLSCALWELRETCGGWDT